jgi:hypothetical protein
MESASSASSIGSGSEKKTVATPGQENGDRRNLTELNALSNSIVQIEGGQDKPSRAQGTALLRRAGAHVRAQRDAMESTTADKGAVAGFDLIDDPLVDHLTPAQISGYYRARMHVFEPTPAAEIRRVEPIRGARGRRAAVTAGRRPRRSVDSNRPPSSRDLRQDDGIAPGP